MSKKFKSIIGIVIITIILVVGGILGYKYFGNGKQTVTTYVTNKNAISVYQRWTISFSKELSNDDITNIKVTVINKSTGVEEKIQRVTTENMKAMEIIPPEKGYEAGKLYTLKIQSNVPYKFKDKTVSQTELDFTPEKAYKDEKISFKDKNLEKAIREVINKPNGELSIYDVEDINMLVVNNRGIKNLSGIEALVNLQDLYLDVNEIEDINPLEGLVYLEKLGLSNNKIIDISALKGMNLKYLALGGNDIKSYKPVTDIYSSLEWKDFQLK